MILTFADTNDCYSGTVFEPKMPKEESKQLYDRWEKAVYNCSGFV
jgi:glycerol kinase